MPRRRESEPKRCASDKGACIQAKEACVQAKEVCLRTKYLGMCPGQSRNTNLTHSFGGGFRVDTLIFFLSGLNRLFKPFPLGFYILIMNCSNNMLKKYSASKIVLNFHCSNKLFVPSEFRLADLDVFLG